MFLRWLVRFMLLTVVHAAASCVAALFWVAAAMSSGGHWLIDLIGWSIFYPIALLIWAGVDLEPLDRPLTLAINSPIWAAVACTLWFAGTQIRSGQRASRAKSTNDPHRSQSNTRDVSVLSRLDESSVHTG
jgi:hypothetical protein